MSSPQKTPDLLKSLEELLFDGEGFRSKPYPDKGGIPTIGYGTTIYPNGSLVKLTDPSCTKEQAEKWLRYHLEHRVFPGVDELCLKCPVEVPMRVYVALCSLAYNSGSGWLKKPSFIEVVKESKWGTFDEANRVGCGLCGVFLKYTKETVDGNLVFSKGLYNRRVKEIKYMLGK